MAIITHDWKKPANISQDFDRRFFEFIKGCRDIHAATARRIGAVSFDDFQFEIGAKYIKVIRSSHGGQRSVHCFVAIQTGDVYKPASWSGPSTKHARGNIFDDHSGLGAMGPYGPLNLR